MASQLSWLRALISFHLSFRQPAGSASAWQAHRPEWSGPAAPGQPTPGCDTRQASLRRRWHPPNRVTFRIPHGAPRAGPVSVAERTAQRRCRAASGVGGMAFRSVGQQPARKLTSTPSLGLRGDTMTDSPSANCRRLGGGDWSSGRCCGASSTTVLVVLYYVLPLDERLNADTACVCCSAW